MNIRKARAEDAAALAEFNTRMALETEATKLVPEVIQAGVEAMIANPSRGFYLVAEIDGDVQASLMITTEWSDWRNGAFWWVQSVYVRPVYRRRGLYRALYARVKELAAEEGNVCGFRLYVERDNTGAQRTYAALGMHEKPYFVFEELVAGHVFAETEPGDDR